MVSTRSNDSVDDGDYGTEDYYDDELQHNAAVGRKDTPRGINVSDSIVRRARRCIAKQLQGRARLASSSSSSAQARRRFWHLFMLLIGMRVGVIQSSDDCIWKNGVRADTAAIVGQQAQRCWLKALSIPVHSGIPGVDPTDLHLPAYSSML